MWITDPVINNCGRNMPCPGYCIVDPKQRRKRERDSLCARVYMFIYRFWGFGFWANWGSQLGPQMCLNGTPLK